MSLGNCELIGCLMIINVAMQMSYDNECKIKTRFWAQGGQFLTELESKRQHAALSVLLC